MQINQAGRRAIGAASFDPGAYEDLRDDASATVYAVGVVIAATVAAALGGLLWAQFAASPPPIYKIDIGYFLLHSVAIGSVLQVALWLVWVFVTWFFLTQILVTRDVTFVQLVRTMGFAFAPMAIQILIFFPVLEFPIGMIAIGATVGCSVLAVRAASGAPAGHALLATVVGFAVFALALGLLGTSDSDNAPGIFALDPNSLSLRQGFNLDSGE